MDEKGKYALVTGGASGLGLAMIRELLKNGLQGVLIADLNDTLGKQVCTDLESEFTSANIVFVKTDVTKDEDYEAAYKQAISSFGQLDIVINNAGILNEQEIVKEMNINFGGVVRGSVLGLKYLGKDKLGKGGIILNISSIAAVDSAHITPVYTACKSGILTLSRGLGDSYHFNRTGVRVVTLCPSLTDTPILLNLKVFDECKEEFQKSVAGLTMQKADVVGRAALYIIKNAESATVWIVESNKLHKLEIPKWEDCSTLIEQY